MKKLFKITTEKIVLKNSRLRIKIISMEGPTWHELPDGILQENYHCFLQNNNREMSISVDGKMSKLLEDTIMYSQKEWEEKKLLIAKCQKVLEENDKELKRKIASWYGVETIEF